MAVTRRERILILAKTYPSPSARHIETSCVAGINEDGLMRRLYPVPFRMLSEGQKFKKWQWIEAAIEKAPADHRPESYKIDIGTLEVREQLTSSKGWVQRWEWIDRIPVFSNFSDMERARLEEGISLALLRPTSVLELEIKTAAAGQWTTEELEKLTRAQMQGNLFSEVQAQQDVRELRKIPFNFYYKYRCDFEGAEDLKTHKIIDWEAGALYWKVHRDHGPAGWEQKFRDKLGVDLVDKDLMFLMGNQHRFQDQWLIISLIYPPRRAPAAEAQLSLL